MIKWASILVTLFVLGLLSASLTLGNPGNDCKNTRSCPGDSCDKENGHFARCTSLTLTLPTLTVPTLPIPTTTEEVPTVPPIPPLPLPTTTDTTSDTTGTTTEEDKKNHKEHNGSGTIPPPTNMPPSNPITVSKIHFGHSALRTAAVNFGCSLAGFIAGLAAAWVWCLRLKK